MWGGDVRIGDKDFPQKNTDTLAFASDWIAETLVAAFSSLIFFKSEFSLRFPHRIKIKNDHIKSKSVAVGKFRKNDHKTIFPKKIFGSKKERYSIE